MDKYSIIRRIGKGSQGLVYLAKNKETSETVAIKQIVCATKEIVKKVMKEVNVLILYNFLPLKINLVLQFDHPNIIKYYDIFTTETTDEFTHDTTYQVYVVMEYCKTTLQRELDKRVKEQKPFDSKVYVTLTFCNYYNLDIREMDFTICKKSTISSRNEYHS